jgi:hypothetical protein
MGYSKRADVIYIEASICINDQIDGGKGASGKE